MSKNREKKHASHVAERAAHAQTVQEAVESTAEQHEQHLVEVPKGTSRARFIFNLGLVVFLLLIFSITGPMMAALGGRGGGSGKTSLAWTTPDGLRRELDYNEFITEKRRFGMMGNFLRYLGLGDVDPGDDINLARFLILEQLAQRSGIHVSDQEVSDTTIRLFGTADTYRAYVAGSRGLSTKAFEQILRRGLAVRRVILLANATAGEVLTEDIVESWLKGAKQFNFDYVEASPEDFEEAARAELPDDEALADYFGAMSSAEQKLFSTERSMSAKVAWIEPTAETDYTYLFERYPTPEGTDLEEQAHTYYEGFSHIRFLRPETPPEQQEESDEPADDATDDAQPEPAVLDKFYSFDEVADQVRREAPVYNAMVAWLKDMQGHLAAEEFLDLETEALSLGLNYKVIEPRTRSAWTDGEEAWAGPYFFSSLSTAVEGSFGGRVAVEEGALVVTQLLEVFPPTLPPFADIRDGVADKWVAKHRLELAVAKLETLRDAFGERPEEGAFETKATAEEFTAAAEAGGLSSVEHGWHRQYPRSNEELTPVDSFIRSKQILFTLPEGDVLQAQASADGQLAYLMRCAGERAGDPASMTPSEAASTRASLQAAAQNEWYTSMVLEDTWLREKFNLVMASDKKPDDK